MRIGVDSSVLVAALHANHPIHAVATGWMISAMRKHELVVGSHSVLECYAVLTRLPGKWRISSEEALQLLRETVAANMTIADTPLKTAWDFLDSISVKNVTGGQAYDAWVIHALNSAKADRIATFNPAHFTSIAGKLEVFDPSTSVSSGQP